MTTTELLDKLNTEGVLTDMIDKGLIPESILEYRDIYQYYDLLLRVHKLKRYTAVMETATRFEVDTRTVYRAIKMMSG